MTCLMHELANHSPLADGERATYGAGGYSVELLRTSRRRILMALASPDRSVRVTVNRQDARDLMVAWFPNSVLFAEDLEVVASRG